jgi:hypothetical protein
MNPGLLMYGYLPKIGVAEISVHNLIHRAVGIRTATRLLAE